VDGEASGELVWENVSFSYSLSGRNKLFDGFSLAVPKGKITVITGASGCGKSTLLYIAAGLYPKNAGTLSGGRVLADGLDVAALPSERRARLIGMIFQNPDLQFCMDTVENELIFCLENISVSPDAMDGMIRDALAFCGIEHLRNRRLVTLSGGEKQKAMLACAAALRPQWLALDEPFANIDGASARTIAAKLRDMSARRSMSIVAVDHQLDVWRDIADELIVMGDGGATLKRGVNPRRISPGDAEELRRLGVGLPEFPYQSVRPAKTVRPPVLRLDGLGVSRDGREIIRGCSAEFAAGCVHAVIGESGSGKSSLFEAICGFREYTGSVLVNGLERRKIPLGALGARIGFVFQNPQDQFVTGRALDEIGVGLEAGRRGKIRLRRRARRSPEWMSQAESLLREIGLWQSRFFSPYMLSQGGQRRLAVAALLAYQCDALVCDEPTYAQDARSLTAVMNLLQERVLRDGLTLIFSTHDRKLARDYADRIYELKEGRLYEIPESRL
jgi:energy-coupling factor transport system ATP-binding protein